MIQSFNLYYLTNLKGRCYRVASHLWRATRGESRVINFSGGVAMIKGSHKQLLVVVSLFLLLFLLCVGTLRGAPLGGTPAIFMTTTGETAQGNLTGISSIIRLSVPPPVTYIGPAQAFDIDLSTIRQILIDFPRVVVETEDRVYIGPFSAFSGISQLLILTDGKTAHSFFTASLRTIALHGEPFRPLPREWMGDAFLSMPGVITASPDTIDRDSARERVEEEHAVVPVYTWNDLYSTTPPPEEATPWWVGMLIVAGLVGLVYFGFSGM